MKLRSHLVVGIPLILLVAAACSPSGAGPALAASEEAADLPEPSVGAPSVDEALAREAGQMRIVTRVGPVDLPAGATASAMLERPLPM